MMKTSSEILAFLETAPEPVRGWAQEQARLIRAQAAAEKPSTSQAEPVDENEIALAELDEVEQEVPVFRRRGKRKKKPAPSTEAADQRHSDRRVILISLAVALVVGIGSGVFFSNQSSENLAAAEQMQMPQGHPEIDDSSVSVTRLAELEARVMSNPDDAEAHIQLGALRFDNGEIDAAEEHWNTVLEIDPDAVEAHYNLGFAYLASDPPRPEEAVEAWNRVIEIAPDSDLAENVTLHLAAIASELEPTDEGGGP